MPGCKKSRPRAAAFLLCATAFGQKRTFGAKVKAAPRSSIGLEALLNRGARCVQLQQVADDHVCVNNTTVSFFSRGNNGVRALLGGAEERV